MGRLGLRILYFSRDYTPHDHRFLSAMAKAGLQVYSLRLESRGHSQEDRPLPPEVEQVQWAGGHSPAGLKDGPRLLWDLKRVLGRIKPDLVQSGPLQSAALLVALSGYRPYISMSWGYDLLFDARRSPRWAWATRYALRHSAAMVGDCQTIRQLAVQYGMPDERIVTFPWGVDLGHFSPGGRFAQSGKDASENMRPKLGLGEKAFVVLCTRSWEPIYGVDVVAQAFARVAVDKPDMHLVLLGNGSLAKRLRGIFEQGNVTDQVSFPGQVSQSDLPRYYRAADVYLSASHSDGTSISLLEALACGCPALLSDIPGNREWISPEEQGWFFPDGSVEGLAQALELAYAERERLPGMGQRARLLAEQRADWDKNFTELFKAYQIALPGKFPLEVAAPARDVK